MKTVIFKLPDEVLATIVQKVVYKPEEASLLEKWIYEGEERKTGKWIPSYGNVKCSVCGTVYDCKEVGKATHYCSFCGAKMEGAEDERD